MSRRSSISKRMNLYRMAEDTTLPEALREQYREPSDKFDVRRVSVAGSAALLVDGAFEGPSTWTADVTLLTDVDVSQQNRSPGAVLVIEDDSGALWALTWGVGFQLLDQEKVDFRFGTRILARSALPTEIKSITKSVLDHRARVDHTVLPGGSTMRGFGVDGYGEIVNRVDGKAQIPGPACGKAPIPLHARDSLSVPLGKRPERLMSDLQVLNTLLSEPVLPGLESVEQLVALKPKDPMVAELDHRLAARLLGKSTEPIGMSWPHARADVSGPMESCKISGLGTRRTGIREDIPDIEEVSTWFTGQDEQSVLRRLGSISLEIHGDAEPSTTTAISRPLALRRWLAYEVRENAGRYCFHDGSWYRMDDRYLWEALTYDETARSAWLEKISEQVGRPVTDVAMDEVVIAIGKAKPITKDTLFTFSKVNLVKQCDLLRDVQVRVIGIPES